MGGNGDGQEQHQRTAAILGINRANGDRQRRQQRHQRRRQRQRRMRENKENTFFVVRVYLMFDWDAEIGIGGCARDCMWSDCAVLLSIGHSTNKTHNAHNTQSHVQYKRTKTKRTADCFARQIVGKNGDSLQYRCVNVVCCSSICIIYSSIWNWKIRRTDAAELVILEHSKSRTYNENIYDTYT